MGFSRFVTLLFLVGTAGAQSADPFAGLPDPKPVKVLKEIDVQPGLYGLRPNQGRFLYDLVVKNDSKAGLAIGTSGGSSGIWLGMAFRQTHGKLIAIERKDRGPKVREYFTQAGIADQTDVRLGEAVGLVPALTGPFDFVFIDLWKADYNQYLKMVLPKVRPGGFIVAHTGRNKSRETAAFIRNITQNPELRTELAGADGSGMSVSQKKVVK